MTQTTDDEVFVAVSMDTTVQSVAGAHRELTTAFEASSSIILKIEGEGAPDLTLAQLIESARKTAAQDGKRFVLEAPAAGELRLMLERGGFVGEAEYFQQGRRFWLHEGSQ